MLGKLVKRLLLISVLYYVALQTYVFYSTFIDFGKDERVVTEPAIDLSSLPDAVQAKRRSIIDGLVRLYNVEPVPDFWEHFQSDAVFEELFFRLVGPSTIKNFFRFNVDAGVVNPEAKATLKSVVHYKSRIWIALNFEFTPKIIGTQQVNLGFWLQLFEHGDSTVEIVRITDEANHVPLMTRENTMFPVGWSAERFRAINGKLFGVLSEFIY